MTTAKPYPLDALGPDGGYRTRKQEVITDTAGVPVARMSIVPPLFVSRSLATQRNTRPLPLTVRGEVLTKAADIFANSVVAGLSFDDYMELTRRVSGLPMTVTRAGALAVADGLNTALDAIEAARPSGAQLDWRDIAKAGGAVWARRGELLGVHAPGNAPGVHGLWPQAFALGYRIAIRASRREPFTAHRLVHALRQAGARPTDVLYLSTDYAGADELIRRADLSMVYGGQDIVDKYAGDPTVLTNGPGRTKILITAEHDWRGHLDMIVDSIAALGGTACVNSSAVLYEGDAAPLAHAIAERLATVTELPTMAVDRARTLARHLAAKAEGTSAVLGADQVVAELGDGRAALRPAVHLLTEADSIKLAIELPFPCVWVAPWSRDDGLTPLCNSLVLTVITDDDDLVDDLLAEPTVTNVYRGPIPTHHSAPHIPHEGFL
ncbi:MAG TPA: aldehyde dehydrogenase, partial [Mycobacterium sp.]|nr:aldehyde dehydrogenase [Mycobacterium sp.]